VHALLLPVEVPFHEVLEHRKDGPELGLGGALVHHVGDLVDEIDEVLVLGVDDLVARHDGLGEFQPRRLPHDCLLRRGDSIGLELCQPLRPEPTRTSASSDARLTS